MVRLARLQAAYERLLAAWVMNEDVAREQPLGSPESFRLFRRATKCHNRAYWLESVLRGALVRPS